MQKKDISDYMIEQQQERLINLIVTGQPLTNIEIFTLSFEDPLSRQQEIIREGKLDEFIQRT